VVLREAKLDRKEKSKVTPADEEMRGKDFFSLVNKKVLARFRTGQVRPRIQSTPQELH